MIKKIALFLISIFSLSIFVSGVLAADGSKNAAEKARDNPAPAGNSFQIQQPLGNFGFRVNPPTSGSEGDSAEGIVGVLIKNLVSLLFAVGAIGVLVMFLWGTVEWILSGGDKEKLGAAKKKITTALIGLVLLSLAYMILNVFGNIIGFDIFQPLQIRGLGDRNP